MRRSKQVVADLEHVDRAQLQALLEPTLKDWLRFKTEDLVRLNMQLQAKGMAPVAP